MTEGSRLEANGIRLMPLWLAQFLRKPFLKMGTEVDYPDEGELSRSTRLWRTKLEVS